MALPYITSDIDKATIHRGLGIICKKKNDYDTAMNHYQESLKLLDKDNKKQYDVGIIYLDICDIYRKRKQHFQAISYYNKA